MPISFVLLHPLVIFLRCVEPEANHCNLVGFAWLEPRFTVHTSGYCATRNLHVVSVQVASADWAHEDRTYKAPGLDSQTICTYTLGKQSSAAASPSRAQVYNGNDQRRRGHRRRHRQAVAGPR
jgi:hypothetical protein